MQVLVLSAARPALLRAARQAVSALYLEVAALITVAGGLDLWRLAQNGWANPFYSATVRSMSSSSHDFLYGSFDPSGVMTVDKPPLAFWVQTLSVEVFGFHPLSILVPSALMGVATVVLVYDLVRRRFGRAAGFVAGLAFATTPITVAMSRHNNPDVLLTLCCTAALWCVVRGMDRGRTLWVVLAGICVGLGFETKLVEAFVVVPGIVAAWLWVARRGRWTAARQLVQAGAATVAVGFAWPLVVALTPAADRPWISGTSDNSVWSLIGGYNGVSRLDGTATASTSGAFRLLDASVGGQVGWLLGFAVVGAVAIAAASRLRRDDPRTGWLLLVGGPFAAAAIVFSSAKGIFHPYYTVLMAPFTAALVGAGAVQLVRQRAVAALAVGAGALIEVVVIHNGAHALRWLVPLLLVFGLCLAVGLVLLGAPRARAVLVAAGLAGLLVAPSIWAMQTVGHPTSASDPTGGPVAVRLAGAEGATGVRAQQLQAVLRYVRRHGGATLAVRSQETAAPPIIATGAHVAGIGGYSGVQSNPSVAWFAQEVRAGRIRWVYFTGSPGPTFRRGPVAVLRAVASSCQPVQIPFSPHPVPIYDCASRAALAALSGRSTNPR